MQRYRVNYKLLFALVIGAVVIGAGWFGLWWVQRSRSADKLLELARIAEEKGDLNSARQAANYLRRYTMLRKDDEQGAHDMAMAYAHVAERDDAEPVDRRNALTVLETTVRSQRTNDALRRKLVDFNMEYGLWNDAISHLQIMVSDDPTNEELLEMLATSYFRAQQDEAGMRHYSKMVGYDRRTGEFNQEEATAPGVVMAYRYLAATIRRTNGDPRRANRVIEKMVEANPDSAEAYVNRGQYRLSLPARDGMEEAGVEDIDHALELDPTNADAVLAKASLLLKDEEYDRAKELLQTGLEHHPENARMYRSIAYVAARQDGFEASLEWYRKGIEATSSFEQLDLQFAKARALINADRLKEAKETVAKLKKEEFFPKPYLDFLEARMLVSEQKWYPASEALKQVRPTLTGNTELSLELNMMLCICYDRLNHWEQLLAASRRVMQLDPSNRPAADFAAKAAKRLDQDVAGPDASLNTIIAEELRKPKEEIDLEGLLAKVNDYAESIEMNDAALKLLTAEVYARAGDYDTATSLVKESIALDDDNLNTWRMIVKLTASNPDLGPAVAMGRLDRIVNDERFGDLPILRLDKADLLIQLNGENLSQQLMDLTKGTEDWGQAQQVQLWKGLVDRFQAIRDSESRERAMMKLAELAPNELSNLLDLFIAARSDDDDARMADAQEKILEVVGSKSNPTWAFTEANRLISLYRRDLAEGDALARAENLILRAMDKRPDWHQLHLTRSDLALARGNRAEALTHLDRAADLGPPSVVSLIQHVTLLMEAQRFDDAREQIERVSENLRQRLLGRQYAETLLNTGAVDEALDVADKVLELAGDSGSLHLWYGRFVLRAAQSSQLSESRREEVRQAGGEALAKAVELEPDSADAWVAHIQNLASTGQQAEAAQAVREVQLTMEEDEAPLIVAVGYEVLGRWFDAENMYRVAKQLSPDDVRVTRALASFYLGPRYPLNDRRRKAIPLVNELLRMAAEKPDETPQQHAFWARRTAAKLLAQTGDYQDALDAERLLASNLVDGRLVNEDRLLMAKILARRPDSVSKLKAIELYESLQRHGPLPAADGLMLAQLYFAVDDWNECQNQMREVISRHPEMPEVREAYATMLLRHGEPRDVKFAAVQLRELQELAPTNPTTLELLVRVFSKQGREEEVVAYLKRLIANAENRKDPIFLARVGEFLAELGDLDNAEKLFRAAANMEPRLNTYLAEFLGMHRGMDQALALLDRQRDAIGDSAAIQRALTLLRAKRDTVGDKYDRRVEDWIDKALVVNPDSLQLKMQKGEFLDIQQKYGQAAEAYRQVLKMPELTGLTRAIVLNNLAYMVALSSEDASDLSEAMRHVEESISISGPRSDILDTRAVVRMAMGDYRDAVRDLELAVTDAPSPSKYFHKARAHLLAGQRAEALDAWERATEMGLTRDKVAVAERGAYDDVKAQIDDMQSRSASRRAG